jgi:hypothetical protein
MPILRISSGIDRSRVTFTGFRSVVPKLDTDSHSQALCCRDRFGQPFGASWLWRQPDGKFKRITSDRDVAARVNETTYVCSMMDIKTLGTVTV